MLERSIVRLAGSQFGLVSRDQLAANGLSSHQLRNRVRSGALEWRSRRVLAVPGSSATREQRRMLGVLDAGPGAALSHRTAASVWGLERTAGGLHVVRPRDDLVQPAFVARVHQVRDLLAEHVVRVDGLPVTTPARTILDLAATESPRRVARVFDDAWSHRLVTLGGMWHALQQVRGKGRRGVATIEALLDERHGMRPRESGLEGRFEEILRAAGIPVPERQVEICDDEGFVARVDYCDHERAYVVFIDSDTFHRSLTALRHDDLQTRRLEAIGYDVVRISDREVFFDEHAVRSRLLVVIRR